MEFCYIQNCRWGTVTEFCSRVRLFGICELNLSDEETEALEEVGTQPSSHRKAEPVPDAEPGSLVSGSTASH